MKYNIDTESIYNKIYVDKLANVKLKAKLIDKFVIIPITKFFVMIMDKMGNRTDRFEKFMTRRDTLIFLSLIIP